MALPRFFISPPKAYPPFELGQVSSTAYEEGACHHISNVLRLKVGDLIEIAERDTWAVWLCRLETLGSDDVCVAVVERIQQEITPYETTLVLGFSKGDTNEKVVRQATELGVARIVPVLFARSISRPDEKRAAVRVERLRNIATSAAQQSHRRDVPAIEELQSFAAVLELLPGLQADLILVPWEEELSSSLSASILQAQLPKYFHEQNPKCPHVSELRYPHVVLVIGPEGGITADEIEDLCKLGARSVSLGPTILRVDTAACAALAITHDVLGR